MQRYRTARGRWGKYGSYLQFPKNRRHSPYLAGVPGLAPQQCAKAYGFTAQSVGQVSPVKLGFGSLGGALSARDIYDAFRAMQLPAPNLTTLGQPQAPDPQGADVENALDLICQAATWAACAGGPADITVCYGPNAAGGMADCTNQLVNAGVEVISWSWGAPDAGPSADRDAMEAALRHAQARGAWVCAASGDNSEDDGTDHPAADYPCGSAFAWAVGGTNLILNADGSVMQERAWGDGLPGDSGGGGGFDPFVPRPSWQTVVPGMNRGCPDSAANADPESGYAVYVGGMWTTVGGTSGASPLTAAMLALLRGKMKALGLTVPTGLGPWLYPNPSWFNDVVLGSNGLPAALGWDAATGLGSFNGAAMLAALSSNPTSAPSPTPTPAPPPVVAPPATMTPALLRSIVDGVFGFLKAGFPNHPWMRRFLDTLQNLTDDEMEQLWTYLRNKGTV